VPGDVKKFAFIMNSIEETYVWGQTMTKLVTLVPLFAILTGISMFPAFSQILFPAAFSVQPSQFIDPANNVHTFYLGSSIVGSCSGKCEGLSTSAGSADTTTSQLIDKTVGKYRIEPDVGLTTLTGTPSASSVSGYAWVYNIDLGGATIRSGSWTFDLALAVSSTSGAPFGNVWITVWSCTTNSLGSCTFLFKNWDNSTNVLATTTPTKYTYTTGTVGPFSNVHFIAVEYWISYTVASSLSSLTVTETTVSSASDVITPGWNYARSLSGSLTLAASFAEKAAMFRSFSGSFAYSASISVVVTAPRDFAISANPTSLTIRQKTSGTSTITLTSINGFTGNIDLSVTVSPVVKKGLAVSLNPVSVTLTANGQGTSTLTVSAKNPTLQGIYTVTVTGVSGTLAHQVQVIVIVNTG
jgi:hypothetical protein